MGIKKAVCVLLSLLTLCGGFVLSGGSALQAEAATRSQIQQNKKAAQDKAAAASQKLKELRASKASQEKILAAVQSKRKATQREIDICNEQIAMLKKEIADNEALIKKTEQELSDSQDLFAQRVRALYVSGGNAGLEILMGADDFADYLMKAEMLSSVTQQDTAMMDKLSAKIKQVKAAKTAVEQKKAERQEVYTELASKQAEIKAEYNEEAQVQASIQSNIANTQKNLNAYNDAIRRADADLKKLDDQARQGNVKYAGGAFAWPVPGVYKISSPFGWRNIFGGRSFHKGIDISQGKTTFGKNIVAAADGQVLAVSYDPGGYGRYLTINHGVRDGVTYMTRYGHCSSIAVSKGQIVKKGQTVAAVGSTGRSTGPHLHFEILINGSQVNPMNYYK